MPGLGVDGCSLDTSTSDATHGWNHDSQSVLRIPDHWNGGLVVTGAPGTRKLYASDFLISDPVVAQGFADVSTDERATAASTSTGTAPGPATPSPPGCSSVRHRR